MNDYMFLFRSGDSDITKFSPEEMQDYISKWAEWIEKLADRNILKHVYKLSRKDALVVSNFGNSKADGPYSEFKKVIGGYMIISAENPDEAAEISKECPLFVVKGTLEIRTVVSQK